MYICIYICIYTRESSDQHNTYIILPEMKDASGDASPLLLLSQFELIQIQIHTNHNSYTSNP